MKRRSPRDVIEGTPSPELEHAFVKYLGVNAEDVTDYENAHENSAKVNNDKLLKYQERYDRQNPSLIHTHPSETPRFNLAERFVYWLKYGAGKKDILRVKNLSALHSGGDIKFLLYADPVKSAPIAVIDSETGKLLGYNVLRKTKKTPKISELGKQLDKVIGQDIRYYNKAWVTSLKKDNPLIARVAYDKLLLKYHLKSRFVPAKDYQTDEYSTRFVPRERLEQKVASIFIIGGFIVSLLLLSTNITGFTILNLNNMNSNIIGAFLFIASLMGLYFLNRKKK